MTRTAASMKEEKHHTLLHERSFVMDAHCDTALRLVRGERLGTNMKGHVDLPRLRRGGVNLQVFALWVDTHRRPTGRLRRAVALLDAVWRELDTLTDDLHPVLSAADLASDVHGDKVKVLLSIEDGAALEGSLAALRMFYRLGVRSLGLTWNGRNELAAGIGARDGGLTSFGRAVVAEMNRLGMVVDVSHLAPKGFWDVLDVSAAPIIASHSNARAVCDHARNLTDDQIRALAAAGGVMGMNFCPPFLRSHGKASLDDVVRHIDHIAALVGPEHIGIGSDYDGISSTPTGLPDVAALPALTEALLQRGYDEEAVVGIIGDNFRRVFAHILL